MPESIFDDTNRAVGTYSSSTDITEAVKMGSNPALYTIFFGHKKTKMAGNEVKLVDLEIVDADASRTESSSYCIWQYFTVSNSSDPQKGAAKIAVCKICDKTFSGCCT